VVHRHNQPGARDVDGFLLDFGFPGDLPSGYQGFLGGDPVIRSVQHRASTICEFIHSPQATAPIEQQSWRTTAVLTGAQFDQIGTRGRRGREKHPFEDLRSVMHAP
jgi:hypothetical protein